tara:strand:+ start:69 stop:458 length:390 start_codon:yes stop_codon:yes gene_type:complete
MTTIGHIIGVSIMFYFLGALALTGIYLAYATIHIIGILLNILPPPWYDLDSLMRNIDTFVFFAINLFSGAAVYFGWQHRNKKIQERRRQRRAIEDLEDEKERKFNKYKSFYEREKKKKKKKRKKTIKRK